MVFGNNLKEALKLLSHIAEKGHYSDGDEFGEILGWYLQAKFGDAKDLTFNQLLRQTSDYFFSDIEHHSQEISDNGMYSIGSSRIGSISSIGDNSSSVTSRSSSISVSSINSFNNHNSFIMDNTGLGNEYTTGDIYEKYQSVNGSESNTFPHNMTKKEVIEIHIKSVLRLPESTRIPIEAFEYWYDYKGTAQATALSLFIAGINRKSHDESEVSSNDFF